jgi:hypothetical protein
LIQSIGDLNWFVVLLAIFIVITISVGYIHHKIFVFPKERVVLETLKENEKVVLETLKEIKKLQKLNKNDCENKLSFLIKDVFIKRKDFLNSLSSSIAITNEDLKNTSFFINNIMKSIYQTNCSQVYKEQTIIDTIRNTNNFYIETISILKSANDLYINGIAELSLIKQLMTILINDYDQYWETPRPLETKISKISIGVEKLLDGVPMKDSLDIIIHLLENYNFKYSTEHSLNFLKPHLRTFDYQLLSLLSRKIVSKTQLRQSLYDELSRQIINNKKISFEGNALRYQILLFSSIYDPDKLYKLIDERTAKNNYRKPMMKWETMQKYLSNKKILIIDSVPIEHIPEKMRKSSYNRFYISKLMDLLNDERLPNNFEDVEILIYSVTNFEFAGSYIGTNKSAYRPIMTYKVKDLNSGEIISEKNIRGDPQDFILTRPYNQYDSKPVYGFMPNEEVYNEIQKTLITGELNDLGD